MNISTVTTQAVTNTTYRPQIALLCLQANFTCGSDILSVYALVNTFSSFVNVRSGGWAVPKP